MRPDAYAGRWAGQTVVCIASGPSLTQEDVDYVRGKARVIVVNNGFRLAPWADVLHACDHQWWREYGTEVSQRFRGERWTLDRTAAEQYGAVHMPWEKRAGLPPADADYIHTGRDGGYQIISLAIHFGAAPIVLLGYDHQNTDGRIHWHDDHPGELHQQPKWARRIEAMQLLARDAAARGVRIVNCSRRSALRCFEWKPLEVVL